MILLDGKALSLEIKDNLKAEVAEMIIKPKMVAVIVGNDFGSQKYVASKEKDCDEIGILHETFRLSEDTKEVDLLELIDKFNKDDSIHGILVQLPLPKQIDSFKVINAIHPKKDVDGFHPENIGRLSIGKDTFVSCTPYGIMKLLEKYKINIEGKHCVIVGRSNIVGKPMSMLMLNANATVTVCHSKTKNLSEVTKQADILIAAVGKAKMITRDMIKDGAIVIDVGINRDENNKICGDVDFDSCKDKVSYITPVPGGVGLMTRAMLMENVVKACKGFGVDRCL